MSDELQLLILRFDDEKAVHRRRESLLASLVLHLLLVIFILVSPKFFSRSVEKQLARHELVTLEDPRQLGLKATPKNSQKSPPKAKTPNPPNSDRKIEEKKSLIEPRRPQVHDSETPPVVPEQPSPSNPPKSQPATTASPAPPSAAERQIPDMSGGSETEEKQIAKLQPSQSTSSAAGATPRSLREISESLESPGFSIQSSIEKARQGGNYGQANPGGGSIRNFDRRNPDFSVEQPTIVSDTQGVDFNPWLHQIYFRVRDNWYSVIPELIRTGTKGKVVLIFDIRSNGRIENMQVLRSSGMSPYDRAAVSSVKLSEPFPNFPPAFKGEFITLQFTYLYNIRM